MDHPDKIGLKGITCIRMGRRHGKTDTKENEGRLKVAAQGNASTHHLPQPLKIITKTQNNYRSEPPEKLLNGSPTMREEESTWRLVCGAEARKGLV